MQTTDNVIHQVCIAIFAVSIYRLMVDSTIYAEPTPIVPVAVRGIIVDIEGKDAIKRPVIAATFFMSTTVFHRHSPKRNTSQDGGLNYIY